MHKITRGEFNTRTVHMDFTSNIILIELVCYWKLSWKVSQTASAGMIDFKRDSNKEERFLIRLISSISLGIATCS